MRSNQKTQGVQGMTTRQKVTAVIVLIVIIVVIWQVIGLFRGSSPSPIAVNNKNKNAMPPIAMQMPKPAQLPKQPVMSSQDEVALIKLQQETQAKYVVALNELQMLKLQRDIAETNQAIVSAKLATVAAQKSIVTMLEGAPVATGAAYGPSLANPATTQNTTPQPPPITTVNYIVVSVSYLSGRWSAVLGYQSNLYNIHIGDILPPDQSTVLAINKDGVYLRDKNNMRRKISLVPVI